MMRTQHVVMGQTPALHTRLACARLTRPTRCHGKPRTAQPIVCKAATAYQAPSYAGAASELDELSRWSEVVPDTKLLDDTGAVEGLKAATASCAVLAGILANPAGLRQYKLAVENAMAFDRCSGLAGPQKFACQLDKALINVGALFSERVTGRVSTEVDPRAAHSTEEILARAENLASLYAEMGIPRDRIVLRIPATWEGIQAARQLESEGIAAHLILVYSLAQAVAAAQAGVSVIQPNVGRIGDFYRKYPNMIRDPHGPREDSGFSSTVNPGVALVKRMYNYCQRYHPKTRVMAAGLRSKEDTLNLAGADYLVVTPKVLEALAATPTMQGYNDGLSGGNSEDSGVERQLSPGEAESEEFPSALLEPLTREAFYEELGQAGKELLEVGLQLLTDDAKRLEPYFGQIAVGSE